MKHLLIHAIAFVLVLTACGQSVAPRKSNAPITIAPTPIPPDANTLAHHILPALREKLFREDETLNNIAQNGFKDRGELASMVLGRPAPGYESSVEVLRSYRRGQRFADLLGQEEHWVVPVLAGKQLRGLAFVSGTSLVGYRALPLRNDPNVLLPYWDDPTTTVKVLTIPQLFTDFVVFERGNEEFLAYLSPQGYFADLDAQAYQPMVPEQLLPAINSALTHHCGRWPFNHC
ncbi:MAG TPA: hypothetical protein VFZ66_28765 [Herpetosiphonaceae bacterium]